MQAYLYAVIFDNGTVKVGMSQGCVRMFRSRVHYCEGKKWDIHVKHELVNPVTTGDIEFRERVLCGYCHSGAKLVDGFEWFKFPSGDEAKVKIEGYFELMNSGEFGHPQRRGWGLIEEKKDRDVKFLAAMNLIRKGMTAQEAALKVEMPVNAITMRREYKSHEYQRLDEIQFANISQQLEAKEGQKASAK